MFLSKFYLVQKGTQEFIILRTKQTEADHLDLDSNRQHLQGQLPFLTWAESAIRGKLWW